MIFSAHAQSACACAKNIIIIIYISISLVKQQQHFFEKCSDHRKIRTGLGIQLVSVFTHAQKVSNVPVENRKKKFFYKFFFFKLKKIVGNREKRRERLFVRIF